MSGVTMDHWGPAAWNTLHVFAHTAPRVLDASQREDMRALLHAFARHLPCPRCRRHFVEFLDRRLDDEALSTRERLVALLNDAHNEVNVRTGKRAWTLDEHYAVYQSRGPPLIVRVCRNHRGSATGVLFLAATALVLLRVFKTREKKCGVSVH